MPVIRVFPRRTRATPDDHLAIVGCGPSLYDEADEVWVSVTFTWDIPLAEKLAEAWRTVARVRVGGPAYGHPATVFTPGLFIKQGYVITSRGCPNNCWFCSVPKREGGIRELPICDGWNVLDDNLLACSETHIRSVFAMLERQKRRPQFTGGLEAARLEPWHAQALRDLRPDAMFFAYDTPDDLPHLRRAAILMREAGHPTAGHRLRCYVLCGWPKDTLAYASERMQQALDLGFTPMAMAWRDKHGKRSREWMSFQRQWARPAIIHSDARKGVARD